MAVKDHVCMCIGDVKTVSDGGGCFHEVAISKNNKHVCGIGGTPAFVDKLKEIADIIVAFGICAFPPPLFKNQD